MRRHAYHHSEFAGVPAMIELLEKRQVLSAAAAVQTPAEPGSNDQSARIAIDNSGDTVVVWQNNGQDGSQPGIYARRFDASGNPESDAFRVGSQQSGLQEDPAVAMDGKGDFVIVWSNFSPDGTQSTIFAQRFDSSGTAIGNAFAVSASADSDQEFPSVAVDLNGDFAVAWQDRNSAAATYAILAQLFTASGTPTGDELEVNQPSTANQVHPTVAIDDTGNVIVVWESARSEGATFDIYAQRYGAAGTPLGTQFQVNTVLSGNETLPAVAVDSQGDFTVVWQNVEENGDSAIVAQIFSSTGATLGANFDVSPLNAANVRMPAIAENSSGDIVIVWVADSAATGQTVVEGQRFDSPGTAQGAEFQVNTSTGMQQSPAVAMNAAGSFAVIWEGQTASEGDNRVASQQFNSSGAPQGTETTDSSSTGPVIPPVVAPVTAVDPTSGFLSTGETDPLTTKPSDFGPLANPVAFALFGEFALNAGLVWDPFLPWLTIEANRDELML